MPRFHEASGEKNMKKISLFWLGPPTAVLTVPKSICGMDGTRGFFEAFAPNEPLRLS